MAHKLFPHGPLLPLARTLWQVQGSLDIPGLPRNMTVFRLDDGTLLLHSVVAMDDAGLRALDALGTPAMMVVPHPFHLLDAAFYKQRYPQIQVVAQPDARARLAQRGVTVDASLTDALPPKGVRIHKIHGTRHDDYVLDVPVPGGRALIVTDLVGNVPEVPGFRGWLLGLLGNGGQFGVPRIVKFRQVRDKQAVRAFLRELAGLPDLQMVLVAHGAPVTHDAAGALQRAADGV